MLTGRDKFKQSHALESDNDLVAIIAERLREQHRNVLIERNIAEAVYMFSHCTYLNLRKRAMAETCFATLFFVLSGKRCTCIHGYKYELVHVLRHC